MWGIVGALQSVLKAKYNITAIMLYFRTAERALLYLPCWKSEQGHGKVPKRYRREYQHEQRGNSEEVKTKQEKTKLNSERTPTR